MTTKKSEVVESPEEVTVEETVAEEAPIGPTKLVHPDGRVAYAHDSMIPAYKSAGFKEA